MAQQVSFADPDTVIHKDVLLYNSSGALIQTVNTTSNGVDFTDVSMIVLKPQYETPLDDPGGWLDGIVGWFATNATTVFLIGVIAFLVFRRN